MAPRLIEEPACSRMFQVCKIQYARVAPIPQGQCIQSLMTTLLADHARCVIDIDTAEACSKSRVRAHFVSYSCRPDVTDKPANPA